MASPLNGQRHDRTALILYGSETGNSQDVAEELGRLAERLHFVTRVKEMDLVEISELLKYTVVLFAVSTTGQGEFPRNARKFWKSLLRKRLPPGCLNHVSFTTFGLGDSSYPRFNFTVRKLHKRLEQLGAKELYPRGEGDEQHDEGIEGTFLSWAYDLRKNLLLSYPLPEGVEPVPLEVHLPPKFELRIIDKATAKVSVGPFFDQPLIRTSGRGVNISSSISEEVVPHDLKQSPQEQASDERLNNLEPEPEHNKPSDPKMSLQTPFEPEGPLPCPQVKEPHPDAETPVDLDLASNPDPPLPGGYRVQLLSNRRVTPDSHWQDVRELTFKMAHEFGYEPGDTMTIYPKNFPQDVQALIDLQDWNDVADMPLRIVAGPPDYFLAENLLELVPKGLNFLPGSSLRDLLTCNLDITAIPKRFFFQSIAHHTEDTTHKERLLEFTNPAFTDEFYDYTTRPRRSILEVLEDFPTVKLPWKWVCTFFPLVRGRKYSICSGGVLKSYPEKGFLKVQIIVAIVKYRTVLKKIRQGLCSRYLASLPAQKVISVDMESNPDFTKISLYDSPERPVIFVAPGTGIAPCRSLIYERAMFKEEDGRTVGPCYLFYGGRNKNADYFYEDDWRYKSLQTKVFTAFSRDQPEKIYVQDIIRREGKLIADLILAEMQPVIYVCGSSGNMPKAVRAAILDAMVKHTEDASIEGCEEELVDMERNGLYIQETW